jgi:hypothetical protein
MPGAALRWSPLKLMDWRRLGNAFSRRGREELLQSAKRLSEAPTRLAIDGSFALGYQRGTTCALRAGMNNLAMSASCVMVLLLAGNTLAEEPARLVLGTRLRVTADQIVVGRLVAQDEQSLTLMINHGRDRAVVPRELIITLERSLRPSQKGTGAATGAVIGALSAALFGLMAGGDCPTHSVDIICIPPYGVALVSSIVLVPLGTLIGVVAAHGERWEVVSGHRLAVRVAPKRGGGITAAVSLRF